MEEPTQDAAAAGRLPAPGPKEVFVLDLVSSWAYFNCRISSVCCSS